MYSRLVCSVKLCMLVYSFGCENCVCCLQIFTRSVLLLTVGGNACIFCSFQVLLLVDASFGFEMETFEFLNILQAHGFPKVMGVLTHLDMFKNQKALKKIKKALKQRFWTEVQQVGCAYNINMI